MSKKVPETTADFESAMSTLEALVTRMESGGLPLEQTLREFQTGMELVQACQRALDEAQRRVERVTELDHHKQNAAVAAIDTTSAPGASAADTA